MLTKLTIATLAIVLIAAQHVAKAPLDTPLDVDTDIVNKFEERLRCQCVNTEARFIHPSQMKNLELIPSGTHCHRLEVIVTLKSGQEVCVDPNAEWVKKILDNIAQRSENSESGAP